MRTMSIREVRDSLSSIDEILDRAGEIVITRHGRPVARMSPMKPRTPFPTHADLRASIPPMKTPAAELIRAERDLERGPGRSDS